MTERCLAAFVESGTFDVSLDQIAKRVGISKRMLIHYFGNRESLEERAMALLEERLRGRFRADLFPAGISFHSVVMALWDQTTAEASRAVLLLVMDVSRRGWSGSARAKAFYAEQQRLWVELLVSFLPDRAAVEELLQLLQGAVLAYLVTGDREQGRRALARMIARDAAPGFGRDSAVSW
ncbi:TetR/AcrR family transcriptional regulator [Granulicella sp. dw_53]|uniref:TetR/AcrR family transcriptional regulator n=1 Tax=Granulicella sp. dw_53 TaxID=2719792 RepID=UPI001BD3E975|nr:TetR/AcrR family transcriptional regulator [Granulicella sp. dw_53]